ncbi:MAG: hypothetical protein AYL28_005380, partial [Candidatus Bathyarchaeota archaeon B23]
NKALFDGGHISGAVWAQAVTEYLESHSIYTNYDGYYLDWKTIAEYSCPFTDPTLMIGGRGAVERGGIALVTISPYRERCVDDLNYLNYPYDEFNESNVEELFSNLSLYDVVFVSSFAATSASYPEEAGIIREAFIDNSESLLGYIEGGGGLILLAEYNYSWLPSQLSYYLNVSEHDGSEINLYAEGHPAITWPICLEYYTGDLTHTPTYLYNGHFLLWEREEMATEHGIFLSIAGDEDPTGDIITTWVAGEYGEGRVVTTTLILDYYSGLMRDHYSGNPDAENIALYDGRLALDDMLQWVLRTPHPMAYIEGVNPAGGGYGERVIVTGSGVTAGAEIELHWDGVQPWDGERGLLNTTEATAEGAFEVWFTVPEAVNGTHQLVIVDTATDEAAWAEFTVEPWIGVSPPLASEGIDITIYGYGFSPYVNVTLEMDGVFLPTASTDHLGSFVATATAPAVAPGVYNLTAVDGGGVTAYTTFQVRERLLLSNFTLFSSNRVRMVYPSDSPDKPLDRSGASVSDWLASAFISTKLENATEGLDTDPAFVNQTTGNPMGSEAAVCLGGPAVSVPVYYYELSKMAPVVYCNVPGARRAGEPWAQWYRADGTAITETAIGTTDTLDLFLMEVFFDDEGRPIFIAYGIGWRGTYAAGKYFDRVVYPNLEDYPYRWIIVQWTDTNGDGFVNAPGDGDTYSILASGG